MTRVANRARHGLLLAAIGCALASAPAFSLEKMTDEQLSDVQAKGTFNFVFENIEFRGTAIPGVAEAGSINTIGTDGSSLGLKQFQFSAANIGTAASPLTTGTSVSDATVNSIGPLGGVVQDGNALGQRGYLRIGLPEVAAWNNVDIVFNALYGNPTAPDPTNPNIAAGGAPSSNLDFGRVTFNDIALAGSIEIGGIPEGYKIESVKVQDGSVGALSRQGLLLNIAIDELAVNQILLEPDQGNGVFDPSRDLVINNFSLKNLHMTSATIETTAAGWRFAYHDPQPFTKGLAGDVATPGATGHPDTASPAFDPTFPKASLTFETQMPHSLPSQSRIQGVTLDHLVFNLRTN